jgi:acyl-CoA thioester hydrolase
MNGRNRHDKPRFAVVQSLVTLVDPQRRSQPVIVEHDLSIRVRYQETDAMGRVHHANYINYFELGRTELLRAAGFSYKQVEEEGFYLVIAEVSCRYLAPAHYDDLLTLRTTVVRSRGAKIEHDYQIFRGLELLATGQTVVACVDKQGNVRRLPVWLQMKAEEGHGE